jgi:hypothetical protein
MFEFGDGRICIYEEDLERTELGKGALRSADACWKWAPWSGITKSEITVGIIAEGLGRGRVELKLGDRGTLCVCKEDIEKTELGRELLKRCSSPLSGTAWVYSLARLWICGLT